jgi:hypothetical protein
MSPLLSRELVWFRGKFLAAIQLSQTEVGTVSQLRQAVLLKRQSALKCHRLNQTFPSAGFSRRIPCIIFAN